MPYCFKCGAQIRSVYRQATQTFVDINTSDDRPHWQTCPAKKLRKPGDFKKRRGRHTAERINAEAIRRLRKVLS